MQLKINTHCHCQIAYLLPVIKKTIVSDCAIMEKAGKYRVLSYIRAILFRKAPFYLLYVLTGCFVLCVFRLPDKESLNMLNFSFPVVGILAGIAFSWTQCLPEGPHKSNALLASKRFFHSLVLLCLGIMGKYLSFAKIPGMDLPRPAIITMEILVYYAIGGALVFFYAGLHTTAGNLWGDDRGDAGPPNEL
jgi:hypothetical protein